MQPFPIPAPAPVKSTLGRLIYGGQRVLGADVFKARLNCRAAQSPADALADRMVRYRLRWQIPI